ncbi:hypothetical protein [Nisaea nitritireducens]|uniref:hypothetical protein n=1 Tax=Nisaea nitritireducens TaxID=568392 RepID=UPI001865E4AA|nr:hypothetical protein [Nisaea nitritireducens]
MALRSNEDLLPLQSWRETDFVDEIPATAMAALSLYYELARTDDREAVLTAIASQPSLSGPCHVLFGLTDNRVQVLESGDYVSAEVAETIVRIIESEITRSEDGARRYTISAGALCDVTILPLFQNAGICLAVVV